MPTIIDYSAGVPGALAIKNSGHVGAVRYISPPRASWMAGKPIQKAELEDFEVNGLDVAFVWQFGKEHDSDVMRGYDGGISDATAALLKMKHLERPEHPVFFAVDFNITLEQWNQTAVKYFRAAMEILGRDRVGIYGHSRVIAWAAEDKVIADLGEGRHLAWQTAAWSNGERAPEAVLFQHTGQITVGGVQCDVNEILHPYWGQYSRKETTRVSAPQTMRISPNPGHRGDPLFLPDLLRAWGVKVQEWPGWRDRGHGDFGRIQGIIVHHTGTDKDIPGYIAAHPQLGLCSQIHLNRDGTAVITGAGIAWHAGSGAWPGWPTNGANQVSIGIEAASSGTSQWPDEQLDAYFRICAAILWYLGLPATGAHLLGHKEYSGKSQGKWDPGGIDMRDFRAKVQRYIDKPPVDVPQGASTMKETDLFGKDQVQALHEIKIRTMDTLRDLRIALDQLVGWQRDEHGRPVFAGWPQLGGRTLVDFLGAVGEKLGIEGCYDVKKGRK